MTMQGTYRPKSPNLQDEERRILGTAYQAHLPKRAADAYSLQQPDCQHSSMLCILGLTERCASVGVARAEGEQAESKTSFAVETEDTKGSSVLPSTVSR